MSARRSGKRRPPPNAAKPAVSSKIPEEAPPKTAEDAPPKMEEKAPPEAAPTDGSPKPAKPVPTKAPARRSRRTIAAAAVAGAAVLAIVLVLALRDRSPATPASPPPTAGRAAADAAVAAAIDAPVAAPPAARPPNPFVGSARCADCHEKEHARWKQSWHARALSPGKRPFVVGDFKDAHFTGASSEAWMKRGGERYVMRARDVGGAFADFPVDWVIGGKRMQDDVTVFPDGRWQVLPIYFHVTGKGEWVDYTEAKQGALTPEHPFYWTNVRRMANHECLDCHTTGLRVTYDEPARTWKTSFIDANVACESCHGPGGHHAETSEERDIVHPVRSGAVGLSACARCHGPRKPLFPMLDPDHQFELGQSYDELYEPIVVVQGDGISPEFFADGKPRTSSFEYQAMLQAACYRKGGATCLTCHTAPHDEAREHAELRAKDPDASCRTCHAEVAKAGRAHTHHDAPAAQRCIACHMAPIVSGVLDHFADHSIDVPVPENTTRHGVPSACGVCHADKPAASLATSLTGWWPDAAKRQARRLRLAD
ncbi:MAG TPA: multiheme c-type cytochrome, partial [Kofleriaceae bacterium]|nr:multiheme c-type cytochrome [Kofleriaceae bacterium]